MPPLRTAGSEPSTHEVLNQSPPRVGLNEFATNLALCEAVERHDGDFARDELDKAGLLVGSQQFHAWSERANTNTPVLATHDRYGNRIDEVIYDHAYHEVIGRAVAFGLAALPWREPRPGAHVARAALFMLFAQAEPGHGCPISMTYSAIPTLRVQPELAAQWEPRFSSLDYDSRLVAPPDKAGALCGMAMTEKQGGSDVRANTTTATALADGEYALTGHKWFCSAPMCDAFFVLGQLPEGLSCFLLPRVLDDGERNVFRIQRLKDKLGNRANASCEVEFDQSLARLVGEPGDGVRTIIEMVNHTRLDCALGTTAGMRRAASEATWHAAHRKAFGGRLLEQPLMVNVLADLCVEVEAATASAMRLARSYDDDASEEEVLFRRLATAVLKYWVCKRGPGHAFEALECLGGNGYVETFPLARVYRELPLLSIWEGSGNVQCLDVLRALARSPRVLEVFLDEVDQAAGTDRRFDDYTSALRAEFEKAEGIEARARQIVERMALALQGSLLIRYAPAAVADAFCASRLTDEGGLQYGTLPQSVDASAIVARHAPQLD